MPATMDSLNELSNEELHLRLLEYGMANMPVTNTTRNVLVNRLRQIIGTANSKTRRETVHVSKLSSDDDSDVGGNTAKKVARRATMAPSKAATPPPAMAPSKATTPLRTMAPSKAATPAMRASATPPPVHSISTRRNSGRLTPLADKEAPIKLAASSAQMPILEIEEESDTEMIPLYQPARKLREPSLGKSGTVVTSFQHAVPSTPTPYDDGDDEDDIDSIELESSNDAEVHKYSSGRSQSYDRPISTLGHRDSQSEAFQMNIGRNSISTSYNTLYRPSDAYQRPAYASTSSFRPLPGHIDDADINESPYLSDFTRRLSRLRAEPLTITPINDDPAQPYAYRPSGRKSAAKVRDESLWRAFVIMLQTFCHEYGHLIMICLLVFVSVLFYVIFVKND